MENCTLYRKMSLKQHYRNAQNGAVSLTLGTSTAHIGGRSNASTREKVFYIQTLTEVTQA
jgi:hypothetical protein